MSRKVKEIVFCCIERKCALYDKCVAGDTAPDLHRLDVVKPHLSLAFVEKPRGSSVYEVRCRDYKLKE